MYKIVRALLSLSLLTTVTAFGAERNLCPSGSVNAVGIGCIEVPQRLVEPLEPCPFERPFRCGAACVVNVLECADGAFPQPGDISIADIFPEASGPQLLVCRSEEECAVYGQVCCPEGLCRDSEMECEYR